MTAGPNTHTFTAMMRNWQDRLIAVERRLARSAQGSGTYVGAVGPGLDTTGAGTSGDPLIIAVEPQLTPDLPSIPAGTNLNDLGGTGWYVQRLSANATLALNYPVTRAGHLEVSGSGGQGYYLQTYTEYYGIDGAPPRQWRRIHHNGTWSPWFEDLTTLPARLEATVLTPMVTNCNDAIENGWYRAPSATNSPTSTAGGFINVYRATSATSNIRQEFRRVVVGDHRTWTRTSGDYGATWSAWSLTQRQTEVGTVAVPAINNGTGTTITINYSNAFPATPEVFVQMQTTARVTTATLTKNTTACQIRFDNFSGANSAAATAAWMAVDPG